jgi:hypothetical protein
MFGRLMAIGAGGIARLRWHAWVMKVVVCWHCLCFKETAADAVMV